MRSIHYCRVRISKNSENSEQDKKQKYGGGNDKRREVLEGNKGAVMMMKGEEKGRHSKKYFLHHLFGFLSRSYDPTS